MTLNTAVLIAFVAIMYVSQVAAAAVAFFVDRNFRAVYFSLLLVGATHILAVELWLALAAAVVNWLPDAALLGGLVG